MTPALRAAVCVAVFVIGGCERSAAPATANEAAADVWTLSGPTMGTRYAITLVGGGEHEAEATRRLIDERLAAVNRRMSTYDPESELSRFNASESSDWIEVSVETASVVASALQLGADTGGAFDPTVGPVVNLWGFGPGGDRTEPPTDEEIGAALDSVGYSLVEARPEPPALRKSAPAVYLDVSSIAKGHGVDAIAELLIEQGYEAFMVEIGGEVRTLGTKPNGAPWRIGVEQAPPTDRPTAGGSRRIQRVVELVGKSLATSGDYRNFFEHEGVRYSHTIDPTTGRPVTHALATVTVLAETCREADGLATALLVLGTGEGYDWAVERGVAALFVSRGQDDALTERTTPAWDKQTATTPPSAEP